MRIIEDDEREGCMGNEKTLGFFLSLVKVEMSGQGNSMSTQLFFQLIINITAFIRLASNNKRGQ